MWQVWTTAPTLAATCRRRSPNTRRSSPRATRCIAWRSRRKSDAAAATRYLGKNVIVQKCVNYIGCVYTGCVYIGCVLGVALSELCSYLAHTEYICRESAFEAG
jgi:hypothetical protein